MNEIRKIVDIKYHDGKRYLILDKPVKATIVEHDGSIHEGESTAIIDNTKHIRYSHLLDIGDNIYVENRVINIISHKITLIEKE